MTDAERVRLHAIRKQVQGAVDYGHFPCLLRWDTAFLLDLAARCDTAEAACAKVVWADGLEGVSRVMETRFALNECEKAMEGKG